MNCEKHILHAIMTEFLPSLVLNKYIARIETFDATNFRKNIKRYFPKYAYGLVVFLSIFQPVKLVIRKINNAIHK